VRTILSLVLCGLMAVALHAANLSPTACPADQTAQSYETQFPSAGLACANGILNFSNFNFQVYQLSGAGPILSASDVDLTPIGAPDQTGATGFDVTGLNNSQISVEPGQDITYVVDWFFVIDAGPIASGASLGMDPPAGDISITQYYCLDSNFQDGPIYNGSAPSCTTSITGAPAAVQTLSVTTDIPDDLSDTVVFNPPAKDFGNVMTVIQLTGGEGGAHLDTVNADAQIEIAPEPDTFLLAGGALLVFALGRKFAGLRS